jgi:hypothetical protein
MSSNPKKERPLSVKKLRKLAHEIARRTAEPGAVLVCNPAAEPTPLPQTELVYDRCAWCKAEIYYDREMPKAELLTRICIQCFVVLRAAEERGTN